MGVTDRVISTNHTRPNYCPTSNSTIGKNLLETNGEPKTSQTDWSLRTSPVRVVLVVVTLGVFDFLTIHDRSPSEFWLVGGIPRRSISRTNPRQLPSQRLPIRMNRSTHTESPLGSPVLFFVIHFSYLVRNSSFNSYSLCPSF